MQFSIYTFYTNCSLSFAFLLLLQPLLDLLRDEPDGGEVLGLEPVPLAGLGGEDGDGGAAVLLEPRRVRHGAVQHELGEELQQAHRRLVRAQRHLQAEFRNINFDTSIHLSFL